MNENNQPQEPTNTGGVFFTSDALRALLGQPPFSDAIKQLGYTPPLPSTRGVRRTWSCPMA